MARYMLQRSTDGKTWTDEPVGFRSRQAALDHFAQLEHQGLDWRVGFLLRLRNGESFRVWDTRKGEVLAR